MPSPEAITETVNRYLALVATGTADDIVTLYAADATIEDPIGADIRRAMTPSADFMRDSKTPRRTPSSPNYGSPAVKPPSYGTSRSTPATAAPASPHLDDVVRRGRQDHVDAGVLVTR